MKKILFVICLLIATTANAATNHAAKQLATLLKAMQEEQSIHPDSLYPNILRLEKRLTECKDATEKAVNEAALAYLYQQCAYTTTGRVYRSNSNASRIETWSTDDFFQAAGKHYATSMSKPEVLHRAKIKDWLPLLEKGKNDDIYQNDLLMIVWRASQSLNNQYRKALPSRQSLIELYRADKCREACLMLTLDSIDALPSNKTKLLALIEEYSDLSLCGAVYTKLSWCEVKDSARLAWLEEGLRKYPRYIGRSEQESLRQGILAPRCEWSTKGITPYPGQQYTWLLNMRNVQSADITIYRLKDSFKLDDFNRSRQQANYLKQNATPIDNIHHTSTKHPAWQEFTDTLNWTAPETGHYALLITPSTTMKLEKMVANNISFIHVSRLALDYLSLPGNEMEFIVSDNKTGKPIKDANITMYQLVDNDDIDDIDNPNNKIDTIVQRRLITSKDGKARCNFPVNGQGTMLRNIHLRIEKDGDVLDEITIRHGYNTYNAKNKKTQEYQLYTDRSIYRPGQTVHLSGLVWEHQQWDEHVVAGEKFSIKLCDTNGKEVSTIETVSDSLGVFCADFTLPQNCLPGTFWFNVNGLYTKKCPIRVEEYKRPTFEVLIDTIQALQMPQDSITLTGRAIAYSGAPIRSARVVGTYRWTQDFWLRRAPQKYDEPLDTVLTDSEGRFTVRIPIIRTNDNEPSLPYSKSGSSYLSDGIRYMPSGMMLSVSYEVTSPTGESHIATQFAFINNKAISLNASLPRLNDKDRLEPWSIITSTSTGTEVTTDVKLRFTRKKLENPENLTFTIKSGAKITPSFLRDLPSGTYTMKMETVSKGDTARLEREIVVFSQHDTRPATDDALWVYAPKNTFERTRNDEMHGAERINDACIQLGSSHEAWIHYTLLSVNEVIESRLIHLNDSIITLTIPYEERYGDGLRANILCVKDGVSNKKSITLKLEQPNKELRHKWVTFRDKLQPGQKESWTLQLTNHDGSPLTGHKGSALAQKGGRATTANLMAALYDASLDAIAPHQWSLYHSFRWHLNSQQYVSPWHPSWNSIYCHLPLPSIPITYLSYASFKDELFMAPRYGMVKSLAAGPKRVLASAKATNDATVFREVALDTKSAVYETVESFSTVSADNLQGKIAGLDLADSSTALGDNAMRLRGTGADSNDADIDLTKSISMRQNFDETAFFYPNLHTDANGNITINFTLPESLTTWRLLGLAHTEDMLTTLLDEKIVAQKDLMAEMHLPRFLRQGDKAVLPVSIRNISESKQKGTATLSLLDAATEKVVMKKNVKFTLDAKSDSTFFFTYDVPEDGDMLICRWAAQGTTCSDGEQRYLPVLSNKEWVTDTRTLTFSQPGMYKEDIASMFPKTATQKQITIEYTSQPMWYAIQALPSLAWPKRNDVLSLATAYYAGCLAESIANSSLPLQGGGGSSLPLQGAGGLSPIKQVLEAWKAEGKMQKSPLLNNEDLTGILADETPWINAAEQETERISRLCTLFDPATQSSLQKEYLDKLRSLQNSDGSFSWFPGMKGSRYMTLEVAYLLTRLKMQTGKTAETILTNAVNYLRPPYPLKGEKEYRKDNSNFSGHEALQYLYILYNSGIEMDKTDRHVADSIIKVLLSPSRGLGGLGLEDRTLAAIVLKKAGKEKDAQRYLESVKKFLVTNKEGLTYFEFPQGTSSIDQKLRIHVQAMEALAPHLLPQGGETSDVDRKILSGMQRWLLQQKRTTEWDCPTNTADAVFALLGPPTPLKGERGYGDNFSPLTFADGQNGGLGGLTGCDAIITITGKGKTNRLDIEDDKSGYIHHHTVLGSPLRGMGGLDFLITKTGTQESWGAIYAQYLAPIADVNATTDGDLIIEQEVTTTDGNVLSPSRGRGVLRYTITAKRDFEYVNLHAPRPACMEPASQLSTYRWQNGLGYYRAVKDASTEFYFDRLPRGTYVIEEEVLVQHSGTYSTGIPTIQCLYAPEFSAHSQSQLFHTTDLHN